MTGMRPDYLRVYDNRVHFRKHHPDIQTLPEFLKRQGYLTFGIGKIFHDHDWAQDPFSWSEPSRWVPTTAEGKYALRENMIPLRHGGPAVERAENPGDRYIDTRVGNEAVEFLKRDHEQPFFLAVGFRRPHLPFSAPAEYWDMYERGDFLPVENTNQTSGTAPWALAEFQEHRNYEGVPEEGAFTPELIAELRHGYYASVSYVDALVGDLIQTLEQGGLRRNTVIVLFSDHGYHLGERDHWCKTTNYELDTRVPLIIDQPGHAGGARNQLVELVDLYPTIVDLCGLEVPSTLQGMSLAPILADSDASHKGYALSQFQRPWNPRANEGIDVMGYSLRTENHRYIEWVDFETDQERFAELYEYKDEDWESENIAERGGSKSMARRHFELLRKIRGEQAALAPPRP